jgi:SAM-dependent methyltransferase
MDRNDWEERYASGEYIPRRYPSRLLTEFLDWAPDGRAIEVAAGTGRNALFLADCGYDVDALDLSQSALSQGRRAAEERSLSVNWIHADASTYSFPDETYAAAVVSFYHDPALVPKLIDALEPGGVLFYEHHVRTSEDVDRGPGDDHRYRPNELLRSALGLTVLRYSEGIREFDSGERAGTTGAIASLVAQKPDGTEQSQPPEPYVDRRTFPADRGPEFQRYSFK